jgi:hypothetical protein
LNAAQTASGGAAMSNSLRMEAMSESLTVRQEKLLTLERGLIRMRALLL